MSDHDKFCPLSVQPSFADIGPLAYCQCDILAKARADEREKVNVSWQNDFDKEMTDLSARVEALCVEAGNNAKASDAANYMEAVYEYRSAQEAYARVLALIDG